MLQSAQHDPHGHIDVLESGRNNALRLNQPQMFLAS
jgi:hypothetical protein